MDRQGSGMQGTRARRQERNGVSAFYLDEDGDVIRASDKAEGKLRRRFGTEAIDVLQARARDIGWVSGTYCGGTVWLTLDSRKLPPGSVFAIAHALEWIRVDLIILRDEGDRGQSEYFASLTALCLALQGRVLVHE